MVDTFELEKVEQRLLLKQAIESDAFSLMMNFLRTAFSIVCC